MVHQQLYAVINILKEAEVWSFHYLSQSEYTR